MSGRQTVEASPDVVTGILTIQSHDMYELIDPGSTLSYVTPFVSMGFGIGPDQLHEPFLVSTPVDALSRKSMGSLAHLEAHQRPLAREVHQLASLGVRLANSNKGGVIVQNRVESSLMAEVKEKQFVDSLLAQLKGGILKHKTTAFCFGMNDGTLRYQDRLCVPDIDGLRERIMAEAHTSRYSVHPGSTKVYHDLKEIYWSNNMKKDVADFVAKCPNCQQVKAEHQKPSGLAQSIEIPMWKWEMINMDFVVGLPRTPRKFDSIWVIVD
ncbi:uncharacterized protein [Nicotiana sylvestris]|uniref:uncharacterized protein n=1 Tax=Nicotiana sylvestris TaxID=4096 RepID=UPI00388CDB36